MEFPKTIVIKGSVTPDPMDAQKATIFKDQLTESAKRKIRYQCLERFHLRRTRSYEEGLQPATRFFLFRATIAIGSSRFAIAIKFISGAILFFHLHLPLRSVVGIASITLQLRRRMLPISTMRDSLCQMSLCQMSPRSPTNNLSIFDRLLQRV